MQQTVKIQLHLPVDFILKLTLLTLLSLMAFAGNSILCRLALADNNIDANSFTIIRLLSGAIALYVLLGSQQPQLKASIKTLPLAAMKPALMLFIYAAGFSWAYIQLSTASGALILFGSVQISMVLIQVYMGKQLNRFEFMGLAIALGGFIYWMLPAAHRPDLWGSLIMGLAGVAWAFYTVYGQKNTSAQLATSVNFVLCLPLLILLLPLYYLMPLHISFEGLYYSLLSGVFTSAMGYWLWYQVLPKLSTISAGVLQLTVPIIAAVGGLIWANEPIPNILIYCSLIILSGIALVILAPKFASLK